MIVMKAGEKLSAGIGLLCIVFGVASALVGLRKDREGLLIASSASILVAGSIILVRLANTYRKTTRWERQGNRAFGELGSAAFCEWQQNLLEEIYRGSEIVNVYGKNYPAAIIRPAAEHLFPFPALCELTEVRLAHFHLTSDQKVFLRMLGASLKWPDMKGYALSRIRIDDNGKVTCVEAVASNFRQNLVTAHILEWELVQFFRKNIAFSHTKIETFLPHRSSYHAGRAGSSAILEPSNAFPLLSVQAIVFIKDHHMPHGPQWRVVIKQRSDKVVVRPGYLQFPPAGGFEVYGAEDDESESLLKQGFDVCAALFREYAEELYNVTDLQHRPDGRDPLSAVYSEPHVRELVALIAKGTAHLDFLGIVVDLAMLRHELSFLLVIDDPAFSRDAIRSNWEAKNMYQVLPRDLKDEIARGTLHGSSAGILQLALESERLRKLQVFD